MRILGAIIKILVTTNIRGFEDILIEHINIDGATVITKESRVDAKALADRAYDLFSNGGFDYAIVASDNPIATSVALNRHEGIASSVCRSADDARNARDNEVNILVLENPNEDLIGDIVSSFVKGGVARIMPKIPNITRKTEPEQKPEKKVEKIAETKQQKKSKPQENDDYAIQETKRRPGIRGWLKDSLGIIDDAESGNNKGKGS